MDSFDVLTLISNIVLMLVPVAGAIVLGSRTRGRRLVFGLIGCLLSAAAALGFVAFQLAANSDDSFSPIFALAPALLTFAQCAGLLLLILAIITRPSEVVPAPPAGYPPAGYPAGPGNYQGPWSQA